ncbi:transposase [Streptomyces sp. NPDC019539]|uniref:transposase n=1 Tax=Streptomyces sp. NPDC019539 TaxID=3365063 RepID=UPI0037A85336
MEPKGGGGRSVRGRRIVDAIFYVVRTGCAWRQLTKNFPPWPTMYWSCTWWLDDGRDRVREADGGLPSRTPV